MCGCICGGNHTKETLFHRVICISIQCFLFAACVGSDCCTHRIVCKGWGKHGKYVCNTYKQQVRQPFVLHLPLFTAASLCPLCRTLSRPRLMRNRLSPLLLMTRPTVSSKKQKRRSYALPMTWPTSGAGPVGSLRWRRPGTTWYVSYHS